MILNRYYPYGYQIENGAMTINESEAETVRYIFGRYADGASYKTIAAELTRCGIPYLPNKPVWNKNMVARILQNQHYLGSDKYPALLNEDTFAAAQQAQKGYTQTEPSALKPIKPLLHCAICGNPVKRRIKTKGGERWYCTDDFEHIYTHVRDALLRSNLQTLLENLAAHPKLLQKSRKKKEPPLHITQMEDEIGAMLSCDIVDEHAAKDLIFKLAASRYAECDAATIQDTEIADQLKQAVSGELPARRVILKIADSIIVDCNGSLTLALKDTR